MNKTFLEKQQRINFTKSYFSKVFESTFGLLEVQSPLLSVYGDGIQDNLTGIEKPVEVKISAIPEARFEVVQSLAKWKRKILAEYEFDVGEGIYTHMKALRPDESQLSPIHSVYVDQWDWELVISPHDKKIEFLKYTVEKIYQCVLKTERAVNEAYKLPDFLPKQIKFIHAEQLLQEYPHLPPKHRERTITQLYGAVFIMGIGQVLSNGFPHDVRAPDYDDWITINDDGYTGLNGDLLIWNTILEDAVEISSMGIRVDAQSLQQQLQLTNHMDRASMRWHQDLLSGRLPLTIGGGIGQSRLVMLLLHQRHIGEVHCSVWPKEIFKRSEVILL